MDITYDVPGLVTVGFIDDIDDSEPVAKAYTKWIEHHGGDGSPSDFIFIAAWNAALEYAIHHPAKWVS